MSQKKGWIKMADREKSALYPAATWGDCMDFIRKIDSFHLKAVSYGKLAEKYGLTSTTTKSFTSKIGAAKQFGLIATAQGNTVQLTEASTKILYPTGTDVRETELLCFSQAPLYSKLITKYDGFALPSKDMLANILLTEYRITRSVKDAAAKCFFASVEQLGIVKGGVLCFKDELNKASGGRAQIANEESPADDLPPQINEGESEQLIEPTLQPGTITPQNEADYIIQAIPLESGKVAKFIIPIDATEDDLLLLHDMFDVLLRRKFKLNMY